MADPFLHNLLVFARLLRYLGMNVSPEQVSDLARILGRIGIMRQSDVYEAARALLVGRHQDEALFNRAFELFFNIRGVPQRAVIDPTQAPVHRAYRPRTIEQIAQEIEKERRVKRADVPEQAGNAARPIMVYSPLETLRHKDFGQFTPEEIRAARRIISAMEWRVGERRTRRMERAARGADLDFPNLLRRSLSYGGELIALPRRAPKVRPRPVVVLADISGSMERYTRMVLHMLHVLYHTMAHVEVFVFATRLTRITRDLKRRSVDPALARVGQHVEDWSGGTRIGEAIKTFNFKWARRVMRSGGVVLVLSDGWDTGDLVLLRDEMERLQRSCARLIWLSPLAVMPATGPAGPGGLAAGLQVALPYVDDYVPVYNLLTLEALASRLAGLGEARPLRRQNPRVAIAEPRHERAQKVAELPQMGTSNYVRRTLTLRSVDGVPRFGYEENDTR